jgi:hypothetical protein
MKISSYLNVFDDWELLKPSLWSIADYVDEIVVVDGAYSWAEPYLIGANRRPDRSREEVYDTLSSFGRKITTINGVWKNETSKRRAGYDACTGQIILRTDADEIVFLDDSAFDKFLSSNAAVGQMEMPIYVSPGIIRTTNGQTSRERQSFAFKRNKISAQQHLSYLWLVLPPEERALLGDLDRDLIYRDPLAYTAHLTHWRGPATALSRAHFYVLNYVRFTGKLPWLPSFQFDNDRGFADLFEQISPKQFADVLLGHPIVAGPPDMRDASISRSPRSQKDEQSFSMLFDGMISDLARVNANLRLSKRTAYRGQDYQLDATNVASLRELQTDDNSLPLEFSTPLQSATVSIRHLHQDGLTSSDEIAATIDGARLTIQVPQLTNLTDRPLRRTLAVAAWCKGEGQLHEFWSPTV